jgi:hypothetical protein
MIISAASSAEALYQQSTRLDAQRFPFPTASFRGCRFFSKKKALFPFCKGLLYPDI